MVGNAAISMTFEAYALPTVDDQKTVDLIKGAGQSFSPEESTWHLHRIPRLRVNSDDVYCPGCRKWKDIRAFHRDHVIEMRYYIRYIMAQSAAIIGTDELLARAEILRIYQDPNNLMLLCQRCNTSHSDELTTTAHISEVAARVAAINGGTDKGHQFGAKMASLMRIIREIETFPGEVGDWVRGRFVFATRGSGALEHDPTTERETEDSYVAHRHRLLESGKSKRKAAGHPYLRRPKNPKMKIRMKRETISLYNDILLAMFTKTRPELTADRTVLAQYQRARGAHDEQRRLCWYCLGAFSKRSFQIDHINPAKKAKEFHLVTNLVPACSTCNTSKGDRPLTRIFLDAAIERRIKDNLPGYEKFGATTDETLNMTKAKARQRDLFKV